MTRLVIFRSIKSGKKLEHESWDLMYDAIIHAQKENVPLIIEGNFMAPKRKKICELISPETNVVELVLFARGMTSFKRHLARNINGERHKSHRDHLWYPLSFITTVMRQVGFDINKPLKYSDKLLKIDTTDFKEVDYPSIVAFVKNA